MSGKNKKIDQKPLIPAGPLRVNLSAADIAMAKLRLRHEEFKERLLGKFQKNIYDAIVKAEMQQQPSFSEPGFVTTPEYLTNNPCAEVEMANPWDYADMDEVTWLTNSQSIWMIDFITKLARKKHTSAADSQNTKKYIIATPRKLRLLAANLAYLRLAFFDAEGANGTPLNEATRTKLIDKIKEHLIAADEWVIPNAKPFTPSPAFTTLAPAVSPDPYHAAIETARCFRGDEQFIATAEVVRSVMGNPFIQKPAWANRIVKGVFGGTWHLYGQPNIITKEATAIASEVYDSIDYATGQLTKANDLPIVADALEDAGYTNNRVLTALRCLPVTGVYRGYWPLDLILGKN